MRIFSSLYSLFFALCFSMGAAHAGTNQLVKLRSPDPQLLRAYLETLGFDVEGVQASTGLVFVITGSDTTLLNHSEVFSAPFFANIAEIVPGSPYRQTDAEDYLSAEQTYERLKALAGNYKNLASVIDLNAQLKMPGTAEGRHILALRVSNTANPNESRPKMVIIGQHHARELTTQQAVLDTATAFLQAAQATNSPESKYLQTGAVWFVPVVNPDGLDFVFSGDRYWRKNRSKNADGSRGVDLNRNYAFKYGECGENSTNGNDETYRGPKAFSEPETALMDQFVDWLRPQFLISYHSFGDEVLYPYVCGTLAESPYYMNLRDGLSKELGFGQRIASSSGEDFEHYYNHYGVLGFLLELGDDFQPPIADYRSTTLPAVKKVIPFLTKQMSVPYVHLRVTDAATHAALENAAIEVTELKYQEGEMRRTDRAGHYFWWLTPGTYHLKVSAPGYAESKTAVVVSQPDQSVEIALKK